MPVHIGGGPPVYRFELVWAMLDDIMDSILEERDGEPSPVGSATDRGIARGVAMALAVWRCGATEGEEFDAAVGEIREEAVDRWAERRGL